MYVIFGKRYAQKPWYGPLRHAVTVAVCKGLALRGHRWEPATLVFMSLASLHNYHIETPQPPLLFLLTSHIQGYF